MAYATHSDAETDIGTKVTGPGSAVDNAVVRYDGTTGKLAQGSLASVSDLGTLTTTGLVAGYVAKTADYTLTLAEHTVDFSASGAARVATLPTAVGNTGQVFVIRKSDSSANTVTVDPNGSQTVNGAVTWVLTVQYETVTVQSDGANWMVL